MYSTLILAYVKGYQIYTITSTKYTIHYAFSVLNLDYRIFHANIKLLKP